MGTLSKSELDAAQEAYDIEQKQKKIMKLIALLRYSLTTKIPVRGEIIIWTPEDQRRLDFFERNAKKRRQLGRQLEKYRLSLDLLPIMLESDKREREMLEEKRGKHYRCCKYVQRLFPEYKFLW